jgi:cell division protein FtsQ
MKRFVNILMIVAVLYLAVIPVLVATSFNKQNCRRVQVDLEDSSDYHFVTKHQLSGLAFDRSGRLIGRQIKKISIQDVENRINKLHELKEAEVYMAIDGTVHIYADQRNPVMRVIPSGGGDFFVDEEGVVFRKRNLYTPRLQVVEGDVTITKAMLEGVSILDTSIKRSILKDIYYMIDDISRDDFWAAQIDQIYVEKDSEIDIIPRVGTHVIHLGTTENLKGKLRNLEAFYDKILPVVGWNKYSTINLEYKDQIVCKKR